MPESEHTRELLVIGAGPGGYPAAFRAADLGMKVTLVDPEVNPGGVCLYRGCVPSKTLLHATVFLHQAKLAEGWGISVGEPSVDTKKLRAWKNDVVEHLTGGVGQLVKQRSIEYLRGTAELQGNGRARIKPREGKPYELSFQQAIVASGSLPGTIPGMPESERVMTSQDALEIETIPEKLLVVGAGYIGIELGQVYASLGSKVTLVEMLSHILPASDRDLIRFVNQRVKRQFEAVKTGTSVHEFSEVDGGIKVAFEGEQAGEDTFDKVLVAVGRKPLTQGLGLENTRIELDDGGFIPVDERMRTQEEGVYAVGDVAGHPMLAHKATHEGKIAAEVAAGRNDASDVRAMPAVVFADPEIAWCGLTEKQAEERNQDIRVARFPWAASGRAATLGRKDGLTKLISDPDTGRLLGAGITGHGAGELIAEASLAIEMGAVADDLARTVHTHPTLSETIMEAAEAVADGKCTHFAGKKAR